MCRVQDQTGCLAGYSELLLQAIRLKSGCSKRLDSVTDLKFSLSCDREYVLGNRGVLNKALYGEAPTRGPTPYPFTHRF